MNQSVMDHWTTVKRIHQSALNRPVRPCGVRRASCGGDGAARCAVLLVRGGCRVVSGGRQLSWPVDRRVSHTNALAGRTLSHSGRVTAWRRRHGEVYLARDQRLDRTVAIRFCLGTWRETGTNAASSAKPARPPRWNHPNVATIYDVR
jgi:hypothetical protein